MAVSTLPTSKEIEQPLRLFFNREFLTFRLLFRLNDSDIGTGKPLKTRILIQNTLNFSLMEKNAVGEIL